MDCEKEAHAEKDRDFLEDPFSSTGQKTTPLSQEQELVKQLQLVAKIQEYNNYRAATNEPQQQPPEMPLRK